MDGMRFHDPSRVSMALARRNLNVACAGGREGTLLEEGREI
jgi:hypothetical protein